MTWSSDSHCHQFLWCTTKEGDHLQSLDSSRVFGSSRKVAAFWEPVQKEKRLWHVPPASQRLEWLAYHKERSHLNKSRPTPVLYEKWSTITIVWLWMSQFIRHVVRKWEIKKNSKQQTEAHQQYNSSSRNDGVFRLGVQAEAASTWAPGLSLGNDYYALMEHSGWSPWLEDLQVANIASIIFCTLVFSGGIYTPRIKSILWWKWLI